MVAGADTHYLLHTGVFFIGEYISCTISRQAFDFYIIKKKVKGLLSTETLCYLLLKAADAARSLKIKVYEKIVSIFQSLENHPAFCFLKLKIIPV